MESLENGIKFGVLFQWDASAVADMLSDALLGMLVHIQEDEPCDPLRKHFHFRLRFGCMTGRMMDINVDGFVLVAKLSWDDLSEKRRYFDAVRVLLTEVYGSECISADEEKRTMKLDVRDKSADIFTDECVSDMSWVRLFSIGMETTTGDPYQVAFLAI